MGLAKVPITLDRPRTLLFDMEALELLEGGLNGMPLAQVTNQLGRVSLPTLCVALWAGLKADDPTLTLNLTKKIVKRTIFEEGRSYNDLLEPVTVALDKCGIFGKKDEKEQPEGNATPEAAT